VVGSGEEDLRCRSLLTVCQRRLGLSEAEDTRLEKYSFLEDSMSLWYWLRRDLTCCKYSMTCQDDLLTVDNAQSHVIDNKITDRQHAAPLGRHAD